MAGNVVFATGSGPLDNSKIWSPGQTLMFPYTWSGNEVTWTLVSSGQQKSQDGKYTLVPQGGAKEEATLVKMEITVDPNVPLPGFVLKRAVKGTIDSATKELRNRVLKVKKGL